MKQQEKRAEQKRPPIFDQKAADLLYNWIEGDLDQPIQGERYIKHLDRVTAAIIIASLIALIILAIDFYFFN